MEKKHTSPAVWLMLPPLLLYAATFLVINFAGFAEFATPDVYADTLYAIEAWESGSVFPDGWSFGNQYYVVGTPVLAALLYGITGSPNLAMVLATTLMSLLLLLSLDRMLAPFAGRTVRLAAALLLMGGMTLPHAVLSNEGQLLFLLASYYSCYLITIFVTLGDYLRAVADPHRPLGRPGTLLALALLFATGMHSLRQTAILVLPLCALELVRLIACRRIPRANRLRVTLRCVLYAAANLAGVLTMHLLDVPRTGMFADLALRRAGWGDAAAVNGRILAKLTGFYYAFTEEKGWLYFLAAAIFCGLLLLSLIRAPKLIARRPILLLQGFFLIGMAALFALNFFFVMTYFRTMYCFTWYAFVAVSAASLFLPTRTAGRTDAKPLIAALLATGCIANWWVGYLPDLGRCTVPESPPVLDEMAAWLTEAEIDYLYGDWWLVTLVALRTDGACRAAAYHGELFRVLPYINPQDCYGEAENARAVYLFTAGALPAAHAAAAERGAVLTEVASFAGGEYVFCVSDRPLMRTE
ncbi:MAG: hypothetical protein IKL84_05345 [Clostridia bacterium]|nr:hypothetical protein [Clostridia bacterium]